MADTLGFIVGAGAAKNRIAELEAEVASLRSDKERLERIEAAAKDAEKFAWMVVSNFDSNPGATRIDGYWLKTLTSCIDQLRPAQESLAATLSPVEEDATDETR